MAVTIKLKNASGSDPSASDLVLGELAVRTDNGKIFLKKDNGSVAEVSGGGIDDGDKGDITVSNSGATFTIDNNAITTAKISDNNVTLAKIENIATSRLLGRVSSGTGDPETLTAAQVRTLINVEDGATADQTKSDIDALGIAASTAATLATARTIGGTSFDGSANIDISYTDLTNKLSVGDGGLTQNNFTNTLKSKLDGIAASATNVTNNNQLTNGAGYITATLTEEQVEDYVGGMVTGNTETGITVTYQDSDGTLDFVVASQTDNNFTTTLKNKLDGIAASATNVTNNNQLTNGAGYITATLTNEQVQDIVGGMVTGNTESGITVTYQDGDGTIDFSVASQTDNNFTNSDHSKLDGIESGATADQSASEILTLIKTVDGAGSGLDADTLDGISSSNFVRSDADDTLNGQYTINDSADEKLKLSGSSNPYIRFQESTTNKAYIQWHSDGYLQLRNAEDGSGIRIRDDIRFTTDDFSSTNYTIWHSGNQGSGSGLDADKLDTLHATSFLRADTADEATGDITFSGGAGAATIAANSDIRFTDGDWTGNSGSTAKIQAHGSKLYIVGGTDGIRFREDGTDRWSIDGSGHFIPSSNDTYNIGSSSNNVHEIHTEQVYCDEWFRNDTSGCGLYNTANNIHWYSDSTQYWNMDNNGSSGGIKFRDNHNSTIRGYVYYNNSNEIGFLDSDGQWAVRVKKDTVVEFRINNSPEATILPDTIRCEGAFFENNATVAANKTISDGYNAMSAGPVTVNNSVTVTVGSGEVWTII